MNFDLDDDQRAVKTTARKLLSVRSSWEAVRRHAEAGSQDHDLENEMAGLGWAGVVIAEEHGGQGLGLLELSVLLEELGYACAAVGLPGSAKAGLVIQAAGDDELRRRWLPGLADGSVRGAVAPAHNGRAGLVPDGVGADVFVLIDGDTARVVAADDATVTPVAAIDPTRRFAEVKFADGAATLLEGDVTGALARLSVARAAEIVGLCQRACLCHNAVREAASRMGPRPARRRGDDPSHFRDATTFCCDGKEGSGLTEICRNSAQRRLPGI